MSAIWEVGGFDMGMMFMKAWQDVKRQEELEKRQDKNKRWYYKEIMI